MRVVAQLKNESGELLGSTFDLPLSVTSATLQQICNALLKQVDTLAQLHSSSRAFQKITDAFLICHVMIILSLHLQNCGAQNC